MKNGATDVILRVINKQLTAGEANRMTKITKVTGVKKAIGDYKKGANGVIFYHMGQKVVYYEELPEGATSIARGPNVVVIGYKIGEQTTDETMDSVKAKVTAHYLAKEELEMSNYHYAHRLPFIQPSQADNRFTVYQKYLRILSTNIF